jgi:hypothetical protein
MLRILTFLSYDSRNLTIWNNAFLERDSVKFRRGSESFVEVESQKSAARKFECGSRVNKSVYTCYPYRGLSTDMQIVPVNVNGSVDCHYIQLPLYGLQCVTMELSFFIREWIIIDGE